VRFEIKVNVLSRMRNNQKFRVLIAPADPAVFHRFPRLRCQTLAFKTLCKIRPPTNEVSLLPRPPAEQMLTQQPPPLLFADLPFSLIGAPPIGPDSGLVSQVVELRTRLAAHEQEMRARLEAQERHIQMLTDQNRRMLELLADANRSHPQTRRVRGAHSSSRNAPHDPPRSPHDPPQDLLHDPPQDLLHDPPQDAPHDPPHDLP
jgi:hypothetical protein